MKQLPRIGLLASEFGFHEHILTLNPSFRADLPRIRVDVEIHWRGRDPLRALASLEEALAEVCPTLRAHECRGHPEYRILPETRERSAMGTPEAEPFDMPLALAHLLEHVMIDAIAWITGEDTISGATGARRDFPQRFDIFVECPDRAVGVVAVELAMTWMTSLLQGQELDGIGRPTLQLAQTLYKARPRGLGYGEISRVLAREPAEIAHALQWLTENGFARREGDSIFHVCGRDSG